MSEKDLGHSTILLVPHNKCEGFASVQATADIRENFATAAHLVREGGKISSAVYSPRLCILRRKLEVGSRPIRSPRRPTQNGMGYTSAKRCVEDDWLVEDFGGNYH